MGSVDELRISLLEFEENRNEEIGPNTSPVKQQTGGWKASSLILFTELCLCISFFGITKNLVVYLKTELHEDNVTAGAHYSTWVGTCYLTALIGAYVSDSYWGNYLTIMVFGIIYMSGMVTLTLSASLSVLKHSPFFTFLGLYMISLGSGSIKPCLSAFGADQFDNTDTRAKASFFSWYYLSIKIAVFIASTVVVWIQDNYGWTIVFGIATLLVGIAFLSLVSGSGYYRYRKRSGSPFTRLCQVIVAASRKYNMNFPEDNSLLYQAKGKLAIVQENEELEHTPRFSFLDKAAIVTTSDFSISGALNPWSLCTMSQVEELKSILNLLPIWATFILFSSVVSQESSVFVEQGMVMDRHFGSLNISPASLSSFSVLAVVVFAPIYDKIIVPIACRFTKIEGGMSHLQRAGIGLLFSILSMSSAAIVEAKRLQIARDEGLTHKNVAVPMSIFWQIPQYTLVGVGEVFSQVGLLEFFYDQAPDSMRSLCMALAFLTVSLGNYVTSFILTVVNWVTGWIPDNLNEGHLDRFFWLVAGLCLINLVVFAFCASRYRYKRK
ncbi:protein NRT1/ PTR FAMILY 8.3-like protein [Carex littledalei]|uniref:Protein NRT1/ PTR FAMILY 8.3-like protein n=1 Tax=Carex littledalei TaxID=544730 RepID=A0A833VSW2_9POAL|nr:protein NRT1/ PTR FAMILY 8.3-like protein [Carex littledalei]